MRVGAIDVGTNSCRMLVVEKSEGKLIELQRGLKITRLGEGVDENGLLKKRAIFRTLEAIKSFVNIMKGMDVNQITIIGTSALRDVTNSRELLDRVKNETGYNLKIISGKDEARLVYDGASTDLKDNNNYLIIDIGGGSTEFIWKDNDNIIFKSLNVGAVRMTERYISSPEFPLSEQEKSLIKKNVKEYLKDKLINIPENVTGIGVGGTITTLAAIDQQLTDYEPALIHLYKLTYLKIKKILKKLSRLDLEERKQIPGLQPGRADIIISGIIILEVIMEFFELDYISVSDHGILHGVIKNS